MSRQPLSTKAIVLNRLDYGEADRILTLLTPDQGKLSLMARGVRRVKSKLAGGIELFSVSDITFARGRGELGTLVSSRLETHYDKITGDLDRTMLAYDFIKTLHKNTEDQPEAEYFALLNNAFGALNQTSVPPGIVRIWFLSQLLDLAGHSPNLQTDNSAQPLQETKKYNFSVDDMSFTPSENGRFGSEDIKMLRLAQNQNSVNLLSKIRGGEVISQRLMPLLDTMLQTHLRV